MNKLLLSILESEEKSAHSTEIYQEMYRLLFQTTPSTGQIEQRLSHLLEE